MIAGLSIRNNRNLHFGRSSPQIVYSRQPSFDASGSSNRLYRLVIPMPSIGSNSAASDTP